MILRDDDSNTIGPATITGLLHERLKEDLVQNGNIAITAGGKNIKQADSKYFKFEIVARCTRTQFETIQTIANNYEHRKFYTPRRILDGESAIREVEIIFENVPNIDLGKHFSNDIVEFKASMLEVIN